MVAERAQTKNRKVAWGITGAGDKAFSAGGDISMFTELTVIEAINLFRAERRAVSVVRETLKQVIAMVNGLAVGGGF